jgi:hypothetical protein
LNGRFVACVLVAIAASAGCQLAVEFDRSRLDEPLADAGSVHDAATPRDAAADAAPGDASSSDAGDTGDASYANLDAERPEGG